MAVLCVLPVRISQARQRRIGTTVRSPKGPPLSVASWPGVSVEERRSLRGASSCQLLRSHPDRGRVRHHVRQPEIFALKQQRRAHDCGDGIGQAVAEIQPRRMTPCPAEPGECAGCHIRHSRLNGMIVPCPASMKSSNQHERARRQIDRTPGAGLDERTDPIFYSLTPFSTDPIFDSYRDLKCGTLRDPAT